MKRRNMRGAIIEAVYETCAELGLENVTTKKISQAAKTSENIIYNYFQSKVELLEAAFFETNCEIDEAMKESFYLSVGKSLSNIEISLLLWNTYLDYWVAHPQKTLFYDQYIHSFYINNDVWARQAQSFVFFTQLVMKLKNDIASFSEDTESFTIVIKLIINSAILIATTAIETNCPISDKVKAIIVDFINMIFKNN